MWTTCPMKFIPATSEMAHVEKISLVGRDRSVRNNQGTVSWAGARFPGCLVRVLNGGTMHQPQLSGLRRPLLLCLCNCSLYAIRLSRVDLLTHFWRSTPVDLWWSATALWVVFTMHIASHPLQRAHLFWVHSFFLPMNEWISIVHLSYYSSSRYSYYS